jgi:hypothetical protein
MISLLLVQLREESYWLTGAYKLTCCCCAISTPSERLKLSYSISIQYKRPCWCRSQQEGGLNPLKQIVVVAGSFLPSPDEEVLLHGWRIHLSLSEEDLVRLHMYRWIPLDRRKR